MVLETKTRLGHDTVPEPKARLGHDMMPETKARLGHDTVPEAYLLYDDECHHPYSEQRTMLDTRGGGGDGVTT